MSVHEGVEPVEASPFHAGERRVQDRLGVRATIEPWARKVVRPFLPEEHRTFYAGLPFVVVAARDGRGRPWATLLADRPGFLDAPDPGHLAARALPAPGDALADALVPGADVGVLGIELASRRRNRVNGRILASDASGFELSVDQSFGNCPQYIHERRWRHETPAAQGRATRHSAIDDRMRRWIEAADTFFIASGHRGDGDSAAFGMDASHRGGQPGFVAVAGEGRLVFPDYAGNNHYNTLGNLVLEPRAGLVFVDFEHGSLLQLSGRATIDWEVAEPERFPGARRMIVFDLDEAVVNEGALPLRWDATTGSVRSLRLIGKHRESDEVVSFLFGSRDGGPLPAFHAGQHLPLEIEIPGRPEVVRRTYSLSNDPGEAHYRISVKREAQGLVSRHLHDDVEPGAVLAARPPAGGFVLHESAGRPIVLVSAGVGLTPLVSMLHELVAADDPRRVVFVHGARDGRHHPLAAEVRRVIDAHPDSTLHVAYSRALPEDAAGDRFHSRGRIDGALLESLLPGLGGDFYLCGPVGFMAGVQDDLERRGVPTERIHSESFGPRG